MEQMKKYFASMYKGLDLSECPVIVEIDEEEEKEQEEESPFDESSSNDDDDPFSIDGNGDFDPFLDYPGESNDIADPAPSQARITRLYLETQSSFRVSRITVKISFRIQGNQSILLRDKMNCTVRF